MTPERYRQVGSIYHAALELDRNARAAWLAEACARDDTLRKEVELLLASNEGAGDLSRGPRSRWWPGSWQRMRRPGSPERRSAITVLSLLGSGGMAEVYLAEDLIPPRNKLFIRGTGRYCSRYLGGSRC